MSNDLHSILARHNLKGINVANFSPSSASAPPPQHQPYQYPPPPTQQPYHYPVPVSQPRTQYTWAPPQGGGGGAAGVRPSFAWPAPPQPRYTIDPRHYSYDIWGKAPVFWMDGGDEEGSEGEGTEEDAVQGEGTEEDAVQGEDKGEEKEAQDNDVIQDAEVVVQGEDEVMAAKEENSVVENDAHGNKEVVAKSDADIKEAEDQESMKVDKAADEPAPQEEGYIPIQSDDIPHGKPGPDVTAAATEQAEPGPDASIAEPSSDLPQEEAYSSPDLTTTAEAPVEAETVAVPTESSPEVTDHEALSEPVASSAADAAQKSVSVPEVVESMEPDSQTTAEVIEVESNAAFEGSVAEVPAEAAEHQDNGPDSVPGTQEKSIDPPQQPEANVEDIVLNVVAVSETPGPSDGNPSSTEPASERVFRESQASDYIPEEPPSAAEVNTKAPDTDSSAPDIPAESHETSLVMISPESEDAPESASIECSHDPDEIVQIIDIGADGSTDVSAAIVAVPSPDDTAAIIVPPPPPSPGLRVTIAEPVKPLKAKKSPGKSSRSRTSEKPREKAVDKSLEIIALREGKSKSVAKGKSKKKSISASSRAGEEVRDLVPQPPPAIIDIPPRAPSPPANGTVIKDVEAEEMQVIDGCAAGDDAINPSEAQSKGVEVIEAEEAAVVAVPNGEVASAETMEQNGDDGSIDTPPLTETKDIASPLEDGNPGEGVKTGADVEDKPEFTHEEIDSSPPEADSISEEPQVGGTADDNPPRDLPPQNDPPRDEPSVAEPVAMKSEDHEEAQLVVAEEQAQGAVMEQSAVDDNAESQADGKPESIESSTAAGIEQSVSPHDLNSGVDEKPSEGPPVEPAESEESISEDALQEPLSPETSEAKASEQTISEDTVPTADIENLSSDTSAPAEELKPTSEEVVIEPASTLMELAALILPSDPTPELAEDVARSRVVLVKTDVSTLDPAAANETSDPRPEVVAGEDNDLNGQAVVIVLPDEEDALNIPPLAPMPPGTDSGSQLESGDEGEASKYQETEESAEQVEVEHIQPEISPKAVVPVEAIAGDQEPGTETEISDKIAIDGVADGLKNAAEAPEADVIAGSDGLVLLNEQALEACEPSPDAIMLDAPEMTEPQAKDISLLAVEEPNVVETTEALEELLYQEQRDTSIDQLETTGALASEEEDALAHSVPSSEVQDLVAPATEGESGEDVDATPIPASTFETKNEAVSPTEELQEVALAEDSAEAGEVASQLVIDDAEVVKPAGEEALIEHVTGAPAADEAEGVVASDSASEEVEKASEPLVVESADEARETPEHHEPTDPVETRDTEDLSKQHIEPKPEGISEKEDHPAVNAIDDTENVSTSTAGDSAQTEDHDLPLLSMPVLAEEAQVVEEAKGPETSAGTAEDISQPKEEKTTEVPELVDTAPLLEDTPGSNETSSPGERSITPTEERAADVPPSSEPAESAQEPDGAVQSEEPAQEVSTEAEVLPGDSVSQRSRVETLPDSETGRSSPLPEEPAVDPSAQAEDAAPPPSKHSSKVSFDEPPIAPQSKEPPSPTKERRKSSKSSSNRHSSSRHKVKDVSNPPPDPKPVTPSSRPRRRSSAANAPPPGLFRTPSTTKPRLSRAELAEQAEMRRREAEIAAREHEVQRQLHRARKRAALEEQEKRLRQQEEELARLQAVEREKKRAKHEEHKRRAQEALEQERAARERAEEEARQKEYERAERRRRRREVETSGSRRHKDDRPRTHRQSTSHREPQARDPSPTPAPKVSRHRTEDIGADRWRSRGQYYIREVPAPSRDPEQRRRRRSTRQDSERDEKPKRGFWKSILGRT